jgi:sugar phosphate isomerase/epimerase
MELGIFAKTFDRPSVEEVFDAVKQHGFTTVQFNMACVGLPSMPEQIDEQIVQRIRRASVDRGIKIAAVSGTFNMIHPDVQKRREGLKGLRVIAENCEKMGTSVITLCTGSRNQENMWLGHPDNEKMDAWNDLISSMNEALDIASRHQVTLAFEPEVTNVVSSAEKARELLDQLKSPYLKVVLDPGNLFDVRDYSRMKTIMQEAVRLLSDDIIIAHAKEIADRHHETYAIGQGKLDFDFYLQLLHLHGFNGALILHGVNQDQVGESFRYLSEKTLRIFKK